MKKDLLSLANLKPKEVEYIIGLAKKIKKSPKKYKDRLSYKTLLMIFEKPSLRTRLSFEVAMTQLGGHAIYYDVATSPLGKKETMEDTAKTASRFVDVIMARLLKFESLEKLAQNATVPVIDALSDMNHPCQILGDLLTIIEKKRKLKGLKMAYFGDCDNNVTYSLMQGAAHMGVDFYMACPKDKEFCPKDKVLAEAKSLAKGSKLVLTHDPVEAAKDADVIYTDSWMSYHIDPAKAKARIKKLMPYQVNTQLLKKAKKDVVFMNCLPAMRGQEQTAEVIDGKNSIVFDQAENRLHIQKAILLWLTGKDK